MPKIEEVLAEGLRAIEEASGLDLPWKVTPPEKNSPEDARFFVAQTTSFLITVGRMYVDGQPICDGALMKLTPSPLIVRLPPESAKKFFNDAMVKTMVEA